MKSKRIGVVMGGTTTREASLRCGKAIASTLEQAGHDVSRLDLNSHKDPAEVLRKARVDIALLALQGRYGEDGCVQVLLELLRIPYTGSGVLQSALASDKLKAKELFRLHNVPTPAYYVYSGDTRRERILETHGSFGYPAIVKPRRGGGSVGVTRVDNADALVAAIRAAAAYDGDVLVERFIRGREVTVAILNGRVLGAIEVAPRTGIFDSAAKRDSSLIDYHLPARLSPALSTNVLSLAERAASALDVAGAVRVDMLVTENQNEYLLEVNTLPAITAGSPFARIADAAGFDLLEICESLIDQAALRVKIPIPAARKADVVSLGKPEERGLRVVTG